MQGCCYCFKRRAGTVRDAEVHAKNEDVYVTWIYDLMRYSNALNVQSSMQR